jgi:hypothetical protein
MSRLRKITLLLLFTIVLIASIVGAVFAYRYLLVAQDPSLAAASPAKRTPTPIIPPSPTPTVAPLLPAVDPAGVRGIGSQLRIDGVDWVRVGWYPTCGREGLAGTSLQQAVADYHSQGVHVLLVSCQAAASAARFDAQQFSDAAQSGADAVQCGNEQMKQDAHTTYMTPADFARFYDLCSGAVQRAQPNIPVLMGSLDPHVGGVDSAPLYAQVNYLNQMQDAMNHTVHPGGNWHWRDHALGLIDSWHNGYPDQEVNSLSNLFQFWAQQFKVNLERGELGKHLWVVEGTGCFKGCGLDPTNAYQVAVSHILTLITDVQTALRYKVPFFYFSAKDFMLDGVLWPIGVLDLHGKAKPLRQDLALGARSLTMKCLTGQVRVTDQVQLLITLYQGCSLPANYASILSS